MKLRSVSVSRQWVYKPFQLWRSVDALLGRDPAVHQLTATGALAVLSLTIFNAVIMAIVNVVILH